MIFAQKDFEIEDILCKPLMAHLATTEEDLDASHFLTLAQSVLPMIQL